MFTETPTSTPSPSPSSTTIPTPTPSPTNTPAPAAIEFVSAQPATIYGPGSGGPTQSVLIFRVTDAFGNPVGGVRVSFSLLPVVDASLAPTQATSDANGGVQSTLSSGRQALAVTVTAAIESTAISVHSIPVNILGGVASRFSLAHEFHNVAGRVLLGLTDVFTAYVADRFGNPVPPGRVVSFVTNSGAIMHQMPTDPLGEATATLVSAEPLPANGIVTTLAMTHGERPFTDNNGNGVCDDGVDTLRRLPEPYFDGNCNGSYDRGEAFIDLNQDGIFNDDQGAGTCGESLVIFTSLCTTFSGATQVSLTRAGSGPIAAGGSADFTLIVSDDLGNPIVWGSTVRISVQGSRGRLVGPATVTIPDAITFNQLVDGVNRFRFSVVDGEPAASGGETDVVTVTVDSHDLPAGGNGSMETLTQLTFLGAQTPTPAASAH